jgi:4-amino-4-deoxy-L-arabinose transferase-like glycosyltransferase
MAKIKIKKELVLLFLILLLGAFLRLFQIDEYMTFLGDEGRDVLLVRRLLVNGDLILIGPGSSVGGMYLGPLYYYLMAPALLLANFSPVGPAVMIALLGTATIYLVYFVAKKWFTPRAGLIAALLYAISPTVIVHSRSSWNPNIMPFFSLLVMYSLWQVWQEKKFKWLLVLGISLAFVLQSHYLGLLLIPVIFVFLFLTLRNLKSTKSFSKYSLLGLFIFLVLMSPLLIFDLRHNFMNFQALKNFLSQPGGDLAFNLSFFLKHIWLNFRLIITRLLAGRNEIAGLILALFFAFVLVVRFLEKSLGHKHCQFLLVWLGFGVLGISFLNHQIYDHYIGFLFTAPFLFLAGLSEYLSEKVDRKLVLLGVGVLVAVNLLDNPLRHHPNRQLGRSRVVAQKILLEAKGEKFNLAVLAERNYEDGYAYFLEKEGVRPLHADRWDEATISNQLFVVCERLKEECKPTTDPKAEIVNFGMTKIESEWEVGGVILYKLVHAK